MDSTLDEVLRGIGRLEGQVSGLKETVGDIKTDTGNIDTRLHHVEHKAKTNSLVTAGVTAGGISLLSGYLKGLFGLT